MPDVWTHLICGREVLASVEERFRKLANSEIKLYYFGCQGPDFFFYYNFLPWVGDKLGMALGNRIHHEKCGLFFRESLKYLKKTPHIKTTVYLMALICHWCLDRTTHPYINYISGVYQGEGGQEKVFNNHKRVEAAIDALMAKRILNIDVKRVPVHNEIFVGDCLPGEILSFYQHILPLVHREYYEKLEGPDFLNKSYRDMITALKILHDPRGIKRMMAAAYDTFSMHLNNMRYYFYRSPEDNGEPYLNEKKCPWCHPMDSDEMYTYSFPELFSRSVMESVELINLSMGFISGEVGEMEIEQAITDISHSTGKPDIDIRPMLHFGPVLDGG